MRFFPALILVLLLCGCAGQKTEAPAIAEDPNISKTAVCYTPSDLEVQTNGAVRAYQLDLPDACSIHVVGENLLVLSLDGTTQLTMLTGNNLLPVSMVSCVVPSRERTSRFSPTT